MYGESIYCSLSLNQFLCMVPPVTVSESLSWYGIVSESLTMVSVSESMLYFRSSAASSSLYLCILVLHLMSMSIFFGCFVFLLNMVLSVICISYECGVTSWITVLSMDHCFVIWCYANKLSVLEFVWWSFCCGFVKMYLFSQFLWCNTVWWKHTRKIVSQSFYHWGLGWAVSTLERCVSDDQQSFCSVNLFPYLS